MLERECPICGRTVDEFRGPTSVTVNSYRCGGCGSFCITLQALQQCREFIRAPVNQEALRAAIRESVDQGRPPPIFERKNVRDCLAVL